MRSSKRTRSAVRFALEVAVCAVLLIPASGAVADQNDPRLDRLFHTMRATQDPEQAYAAELEIWGIWMQHRDRKIESRLARGARAMDRDYVEALKILTDVIEAAPEFAEGWNKRATLYYLMGEYALSEADIFATLDLEPRHFGALSGLGLVYMAQSKHLKAREAFQEALEVHPHSVATRNNIRLINEYFSRTTI